MDPPTSGSVAAALYATSPRQITALLAHCEGCGWRPTAISDDPDSLAALVRLGPTEVVVAMTWHRHLADAVSAAGGRLEVVRHNGAQPAPGALAEQLAALVAAGRLSHGEMSALLAAAGSAGPPSPDPVRRPRRAG